MQHPGGVHDLESLTLDGLPADKRGRAYAILDGWLPYEEAVEAIWQIAPELGYGAIERIVRFDRFGAGVTH